MTRAPDPRPAPDGERLPPGARKAMTPEQRTQRARLAAHSRWARPTARQEQSVASKEAIWRYYENQVDPDVLLPDDQRRRLAVSAARAHAARMHLARWARNGQQ